MQSDSKTRNLAAVTAAVVTTAAFAKVFVPFYLIGSTPIFAAFVSLGFILAIFNWRQLWETARHIPHLLPVGMGLLYALVIISYLLNSRSEVPLTHLLGILIFHTIFLAFGIMASRAPQAILWTLLSAGAIYLIVIVQHTLRFGDLMRNGYLNDLFGIGDVAIFQAFHQNIGIVLGLATLAGFGLTSNRMKQILAIVVLLLILLFFYHIGARGGLLALVCSLAFLVSGRLWMHSRKKALLIALAVILSVAFVSAILYQRALQYKSVDQVSPDVISRTMREIQDTNPD